MTFSLKDFDGPLDLLLHLINKAQVDIKDIFVSQITDQYIEHVQNAVDLDMDDATDFLVMAATLLEIKSRAMLPRPPRLEEDEEDPEQALIRRRGRIHCQPGQHLRGRRRLPGRMWFRGCHGSRGDGVSGRWNATAERGRGGIYNHEPAGAGMRPRRRPGGGPLRVPKRGGCRRGHHLRGHGSGGDRLPHRPG